MNARTRREFEQRKVLRDAGWDVPKRDAVAFNSGSETLEHFLCKAIAAYELRDQGYRVASEVEGIGGEIDLVAYGTEDPPIAIEAETNPTDDVVSQKLEQYVWNQPFRDMFLLDVGSFPTHIYEARGWVSEQL